MLRRLHAAGKPVPFVLLVFVCANGSAYSAFSVAEIKAVSPNTTVIARILTPDKDYHADDVGGWDKATRAGGRAYFDKYAHLITEDMCRADYIQIKDLNEPGTGTGDGFNAWTQGILDGADAYTNYGKRGLYLAIDHFSVGNPGLPNDSREDAKYWILASTWAVLRRVKQGGHAFCLHQYNFNDNWTETALGYRHRLIYPLLPSDLQNLKLWLTEFGEGWMTYAPADRSPTRYAARLRTANAELRNSPGNPDAALWTVGAGGDEWARDLLDGILPTYEQMALES